MQSSKFNRRHVRRNVTQINTTTTQKFVKVGPKVPERYSSVHGHNLSESSNLSLSSSEAKKEGEKTKSAADELNYYMSKEHLKKADTVPRNYRHRRETDSPESYSSIDRLNYHNEREMRYRERSPFEERRHSVNDRNYRDVHRSESGTSGEIYERGHGHYHESPSRSYGHEMSGEYIFSQKQKISHEESNYRKNHKEHRVGNTTYESRRSRSPKFSKGSIHESIKVESESRHSDRGGGALLFEDGEHVPTADERHTSQSSHDTHSRHSGALLIEDGSNVTYGDVRQRSHEIESVELEHVSEDSDIVDGLKINRRNDVYGLRSDTYQFDRDQDYEKRSLSSRHETRSSSRAKEHLDSEYEHSNVSDLRSERSKRRLSPVSAGTLSSRGSKYKRGLSPVSHEDLTIHISDHGRWIEGKHSQESIDEHLNANSERDERHFQDGKVMIKNDYLGDLDREMVSDDESYIDDHVDNFRSYLEVGRDNIRSNKEVFDDRYSSGTPHLYERVPESSVKVISHKSVEKGLNIPDLCKHYNKNKNVDQGCLNAQCKNLHICKAMVLESCKFGPRCKKSHEFIGQSRKLLMNLNPGLDLDSRHTYWKICMILQKKILIDCGREDLLEVIDEKFADRLRSLEEAKADKREIAQDPQPSISSGFFSKARSGLKDNTSRHLEKERRRSNEEISRNSIDIKKENHRRTPDVQTVSRHSKGSSEKVMKIDKDKKHAQQGPSEDIKGSLSPVSGDERNWEEHETYDKVSDDGISDVSEKQPDLESVSSNDSDDDVNRHNTSVSYSAPVPMPENIAVPIGMNEPLVFNRPLGKNQTYIGPLNRPPPMVPLNPNQTSQPPQFNVHEPKLTGSTVISGFPVGIGGPFMMPNLNFPPNLAIAPPVNHLPSQNFLKQIIQQFPPVQVQSPPKNTFKNENTPAVFEAIIPKPVKKKKSVEKDPEFKETITSLWTFPNKSVVNMSIIEFVTETEAYKEEFVAEILKILVTLELPYVTIKKLMSLIKEKILINIKSPADMKKILELYPLHFSIIETVESDDDSDDESARKSVKIKAKVNLGFCDKHGFLPFAVGKCECNLLHVCKFYLLSQCPQKSCKFGHKLKTDHNISVLKNLKLHRLTGEEIVKYISDVDNRNKETIPLICKYYTREKGCYKGDSTDYDSICHSLHLCIFKARGVCTNKDCEKSHSIRAIQPHSLLVKYGLDPDELGDEKVLQMIRDTNLEQETIKKNVKAEASVPQKAGGVLIAKTAKPVVIASGSKLVKRGSELEDKEMEIKRKISDLERRDFNIPAVCKFYQNEIGCRKKDWGSDGKCHFLHLCQYFVINECKFGETCKRSHDLYSGHTVETLRKYKIDPYVVSKEEILELLSKSSDKAVLPPKEESNSKGTADQENRLTPFDDKMDQQKDENEEKKVVEKEKVKKSMEEIMAEKVPLHKQLQELKQQYQVPEATKVSINRQVHEVLHTLPSQGGSKREPDKKPSPQFKVAAEGGNKRYDMKTSHFQSSNIEDLIRNVIQEKKVDLSKVNDRCYGQYSESKPGGQKH